MFVLHPGSEGDIVHGEIEEFDWRTERPFEALSYVWGDTSDTEIIKIGCADVAVTKSLGAALRQLRYPDRHRTLWVDYLCINQSDVSERNQQVAGMGLIYERSQRVLVWLGEATPDTKVGMDIIQYFASEPRPQPYPIWQHYPLAIVQASLADVMGRPWFQRMWVVQEIGRSHAVVLVCGEHQVGWTSSNCNEVRVFSRMIKYAELLPRWTQMGLNAVDLQPLLEMLDVQIGNELDRSHGGTHRLAPDILDIAYTMRYKQCKDPRDKVYGVYGVPPHMIVFDAEKYPVDYNLTTEEVYEALGELAFRS